MNKTFKITLKEKFNFTIEMFGTNGSKTITGNKSVLFSKIVTTCGKNTWMLLHQN